MSPVNKQAIAAAFGRAARSYSQHDELQRQSAEGLLALLGETCFSQVLDAGCGPGGNSRYWRETGSQVTAIDLSPDMLAEARQQQAAHHYLVADIEGALEWARSQRARVTVAPVAAVAFGGRRISFVMFRNGLMLEFIER